MIKQMDLFQLPTPAPTFNRAPLSRLSVIYRPKGRALEYSAWALNVYRGCSHRCAYCFAPGATRRTREDFEKPTTRVGKFVDKIERDAAILQSNEIRGPVLLSFTTDPYQPLDREWEVTRTAIQILHEHDIGVHILTKAGLAAMRDQDLIGQHDLDAAAASLTFTSTVYTRKWEPGAALAYQRREMLRRYHEAGAQTWASCEPVIYPEQTLDLIWSHFRFVDEFRIGKTNHVGDCPPELAAIINQINWSEFVNAAVSLCKELGQAYYIKKDLIPYLTS